MAFWRLKGSLIRVTGFSHLVIRTWWRAVYTSSPGPYVYAGIITGRKFFRSVLSHLSKTKGFYFLERLITKIRHKSRFQLGPVTCLCGSPEAFDGSE